MVTNQNISSKDTAESSGLNLGLNLNGRAATDLELVKRAQEGDSEAFAALFHAHKARVYSICVRMTNNTAQAEDLTQDAFLQVFRKLSTFKGNSALSTWLYRIAVRESLNYRRWFWRHLRFQSSIEDEKLDGSADFEDTAASPFDELASREIQDTVQNALREVPAVFRTAVILRDLEGLPYEDVAEVMARHKEVRF